MILLWFSVKERTRTQCQNLGAVRPIGLKEAHKQILCLTWSHRFLTPFFAACSQRFRSKSYNLFPCFHFKPSSVRYGIGTYIQNISSVCWFPSNFCFSWFPSSSCAYFCNLVANLLPSIFLLSLLNTYMSHHMNTASHQPLRRPGHSATLAMLA